eukprot:TRINITY_DN37675_c0_g1_i2.p1 TRINITY_DN37675_c0_g1~~TRINITY_DN37675_c0_g1_i2.p1  ORF type:complete len:317 (-),score=79.89 TRINITY_DN37675_c0_g1_i2:816-1766(-)
MYVCLLLLYLCFFFFQAEDGIRDAQESRGLGDVYKRQGRVRLLENQEEEEEGETAGLTRVQLVFAIIKGIVGPAILYIPHGFKQGGCGFSIPMLWLSWCMFNWGISRMVQVWVLSRTSYADMMTEAFGWAGGATIRWFVLLQQCGVCVTYYVFIAKNLNSVTGIDLGVLCLLQLTVHIPLCWIRDIKNFRFTNIASSWMIVACLFVLLGSAVQDDADHSSTGLTLFNSARFDQFVGTASFAWEGMAALAIPLANASSKQARNEFTQLFQWTTAGITVVYTMFGLVNFAAYGEVVLLAYSSLLLAYYQCCWLPNQCG